jgi:hypothetical protein
VMGLTVQTVQTVRAQVLRVRTACGKNPLPRCWQWPQPTISLTNRVRCCSFLVIYCLLHSRGVHIGFTPVAAVES